MSDHIDRNGKRYYAEEYFLGLLKTSKRRRKRIEALKATIKRIEPLPDKWEHEDTGYYLEMSQCAIDLRKALNQQEQDHE